MLNDTDQRLLEAYLDDALSATDVERLDRRLNMEPQLFGALDQMRRQRAIRIAFFKSQTPGEAEADRFANRVIVAARRRGWHEQYLFGAKLMAGLAACLLIGFSVGWMGRGVTAPTSTPSHVVANPASAHSESRLVVHSPKPAESGQFQVAILDENGNVIALQRFNKVEEAHAFADDLAQYQVRRQQVQEGQAMLVSDQF